MEGEKKDRWRVRLVGADMDLARLGTMFETGAVRVVRDEAGWMLEADAFEPLSEAAGVRQAAESLLRTMGGAASARLGRLGPVTEGAVVREHADGRRSSTVFASGTARATATMMGRATVLDANGNVKPPEPSRELAYVLASRTDRDVEKVLRHLSPRGTALADAEPSFFTLFKVFEVIEKAKGNRAGVKAWAASCGVATESDVQRFADSANDAALSGDDARHAKDFNNPSAGPAMGLQESESLVRRMALAWLEERVP